MCNATAYHIKLEKIKGHLISKGLFGLIVLTKIQQQIFKDFCPSL